MCDEFGLHQKSIQTSVCMKYQTVAEFIYLTFNLWMTSEVQFRTNTPCCSACRLWMVMLSLIDLNLIKCPWTQMDGREDGRCQSHWRHEISFLFQSGNDSYATTRTSFLLKKNKPSRLLRTWLICNCVTEQHSTCKHIHWFVSQLSSTLNEVCIMCIGMWCLPAVSLRLPQCVSCLLPVNKVKGQEKAEVFVHWLTRLSGTHATSPNKEQSVSLKKELEAAERAAALHTRPWRCNKMILLKEKSLEVWEVFKDLVEVFESAGVGDGVRRCSDALMCYWNSHTPTERTDGRPQNINLPL